MWHLMWNGEVIEWSIETEEDADYLKGEYNLAYDGGVTIHDGPGEGWDS